MNKLLVVDDESGIVNFIKIYFENKGHMVYTAYSAPEALKKINKDRDKLMKALKESWDNMLNEERTPSYIRSFGYHSGACYAFLLDESKMEWKSCVKPGCDLGELLKQAHNISGIDTDWELNWI